MVKTLGKKIKQTVRKSYFRISNAKVKFSDCNFFYIYLLRQDDVMSEDCSERTMISSYTQSFHVPCSYGTYLALLWFLTALSGQMNSKELLSPTFFRFENSVFHLHGVCLQWGQASEHLYEHFCLWYVIPYTRCSLLLLVVFAGRRMEIKKQNKTRRQILISGACLP